MKFEDLKLGYGHIIRLQSTDLEGGQQNFICKFVGCLPGKSILVTPIRSGDSNVKVRPGQKFAVQVMVDNGVCLFSTKQEHSTSAPVPLDFLSYPNAVSLKAIRGATRTNVDLPVCVTNISELNSPKVDGVISDISLTGAKLELVSPLGAVGDALQLSGRFKVMDIERSLTIGAVVRARIERSTQEEEENLPAVYGVEFTERDEDNLLVLYAFVFSTLIVRQELEGNLE